MATADEMTKRSADDALSSKSTAINLGYFKDPFTATMLTKSHGALAKSMRKRPPIINRGYYARVEAIRVRYSKFVELHGAGAIQVINLGGGFDTLPLQILADAACTATANDIKIFEVDFADVVRQKAQYILSEPVLYAPLFPSAPLADGVSCSSGDDTATGTGTGIATTVRDSTVFAVPKGGCSNTASSSSSSFSSSSSTSMEHRVTWFGSGNIIHTSLGSSNRLKLIGCDLRKAADVTATLLSAGFDISVPTVIMSECTLVYMESKHSALLCTALGELIHCNTPAAWISYDMTHSNDTYGKVMLRNLSIAGYRIPSFTQLPTLDDYKRLFEQSGWGEPSARGITGTSAAGGGIGSGSGLACGQIGEDDDEDEDDDALAERMKVEAHAATISTSTTGKDGAGEDTVESLSKKTPLHTCGSVQVITMLQAYDQLVSKDEKLRVAKLEIFDEVEEWNMLMSHYCLTTAVRNMSLD